MPLCACVHACMCVCMCVHTCVCAQAHALSRFHCVQLFCDAVDCSPQGSPVHGILQSTGVGCHALLQGIFPTQGLNLHLLHLLRW